jgi:hypothetical protein
MEERESDLEDDNDDHDSQLNAWYHHQLFQAGV